MMRDRPGGSFSSLNCSPWWKRTGGVDRSTSSTNPGLGTSSCLLVAEVEGDLHAAARSGAGRVGDGLGGAGERVGGAHEAAEVGRGDQFEGEVEGAARCAVHLLGAVGVGAGQGDLALPEP